VIFGYVEIGVGFDAKACSAGFSGLKPYRALADICCFDAAHLLVFKIPKVRHPFGFLDPWIPYDGCPGSLGVDLYLTI